MSLSRHMLKRVGESRHPCRTATAVEEDCTGGFIIEVFDDSDMVGADVVLLHDCPQSCMPNPVEGLLEVYEDMVEVLWVLEIFLTEDSYVEDLLCGALSCCETCLFFSRQTQRTATPSFAKKWMLQYNH